VNEIRAELERRIRARWSEYGMGMPDLTEDEREMLTSERLSRILPEV